MKWEDKDYAEKTLKKLLIGSQLDGIKFGVDSEALFAYFMHYSNREPDLLWLNIEVRKIVLLDRLENIDLFAGSRLPEVDEDAAIKLLLENRREKVSDVQLGNVSPHLFITLESGKVLCVNGEDEDYECWQVGDGLGYTGREWLIIAVPGNEISFFL
ncbi:hypothetical protein [Planococcus shixiaomingii]|uniref:hypothetical protein n=1 Tax=Planococcus shixiaomingii TaxID=3058393 RepID=UPI002618F25D|nr:hypothetical protein [Planococcus sp. N022]WKA56539.1 hypothetical protein QWY21_09380 [Planococcus sp. N022]